jgi:soluble lytic murein transglycosylase-like protein
MAAPSDNKSTKPEPTEPRRRSEDRTGTATDNTPGKLTSREIFQKMRRPMIGLGMIGAAVPMVNASNAAEKAEPQTHAATNADPLGQAATGTDTEENIASKIALTVEEQEREDNIVAAMDRYDIERDLAEDIYDIAREQNIDPQLAYGLVKTESTFDERAQSHVGARGLTQVMPRTAAWLVPGTTTEDLYDRQTNLRLGFKYLDQLIGKYKGNVRLALLAYNRGPGTVDKVLKRGGDPNNGYADKVLRG